MKMMTENYCDECDEVVHQVFDDEAFYNHTVGTIICPKCGSIVMPCNECDDHGKCGECPWNGVNGTVGMDDCEVILWYKEHETHTYDMMKNGELGIGYKEIIENNNL
jgi:hypothetical protein